MRLIWEVAARAFRRHLSYRAAALAGLVTNVFFGLLRAAVLVALYGERGSVAGLGLREAVTYTGLTQALIVFLSIFGWYELMNAVHRGEIAADLLKPMSLFSFWMAQDLGRAVAGLVLRGLPIMLIYALALDLQGPGSAARWAAVALSAALGWLLSFAYRFLVNLAAFWSPDARGIGRLAFVVVMFLSGFLMPLRFFPDWVQAFAYLTPFPHMLNTVVEVYLGTLTGPALAGALLAQAAWAAGLIGLAHLVLGRATRRLVILGG